MCIGKWERHKQDGGNQISCQRKYNTTETTQVVAQGTVHGKTDFELTQSPTLQQDHRMCMPTCLNLAFKSLIVVCMAVGRPRLFGMRLTGG